MQVRIELAKNLFAECLALGEPKLCRVPADLALGKGRIKCFFKMSLPSAPDLALGKADAALGKADAALGEKFGSRT